jgi:membrane associated rhomboid family serine protease
MTTIISNVETFFKRGTILSNLIVINILVFLLIKIIGIGLLLFNFNSSFLVDYLRLPADFTQLMYRPWTLITYMFTHVGFWHILFNLLWLYWFGKLFLTFFGSRPLGGLYFLGGIAGGGLFLFAYNLFPYFSGTIPFTYLIGASASIMAIVFAVSCYKPDYEIGLLFIGRVKIIYVAIVLVVINIVTLQTTHPEGRILLNNAGGFFAHLGGIIAGIRFASMYKKGKDMTKGVNVFFDKVANIFKKKPVKMKIKYRRPESDIDYNTRKNQENKEIDSILEKIKNSGYNSLNESEKKKLFDASKK